MSYKSATHSYPISNSHLIHKYIQGIDSITFLLSLTPLIVFLPFLTSLSTETNGHTIILLLYPIYLEKVQSYSIYWISTFIQLHGAREST